MCKLEKNEHINIDILATSDMHSHFMNGDFGSNIYRLVPMLKILENNDKVILLDSGEV